MREDRYDVEVDGGDVESSWSDQVPYIYRMWFSVSGQSHVRHDVAHLLDSGFEMHMQ